MKNCNTAVIDIETMAAITQEMRELLESRIKPRGNLKDEAKIKADIEEKRLAMFERAALSPLTGAVAVVCVELEDAGRGQWDRVILTSQGGEAGCLRELSRVMMEHSPMSIVSFNGEAFDLPFLAARCAIHGIEGYHWPRGRGAAPKHIDLFRLLGGGTLEQWGVALGMIGAKGSPSSDVPTMIASGDWESAIEHCVEDVVLTRTLYSRLRGAAGMGR